MPATRDELMTFLSDLGVTVTTIDHPPLHTVAESQKLRGTIAGGHTKNLFVKDKKSRHFLVVAEEDRAVDLKSLHKLIGAQGRLSFAGPDAMMAMLGVTPGSVTAFGVLNDRGGQVTVVLDEGLTLHDMVNCHPLTNTATTTIAIDGLMTFFKATGHEPLMTRLDTPAEQARGQDG
ncbi:prolyl-tRNA synthetase associated domain-containing protein [Jiella sp. MQZ9-1]|uniref:Prolyl-tRNA synthetase associated domain-containing protein n=1 Tax=Jiella flava TaxID=2816857 RepID=A0A939FX19_9HYPH|nr:YbaK/EbsC family protein [Jiella flava]MBO0661618.1 prolyl-tRNA synthetase associated domain-containing protein [Jiella flava]MCD2470260.1 prolyl-tRNA synthetase associated domain-containing protein [Jiella flava]